MEIKGFYQRPIRAKDLKFKGTSTKDRYSTANLTVYGEKYVIFFDAIEESYYFGKDNDFYTYRSTTLQGLLNKINRGIKQQRALLKDLIVDGE